MADSLPQIVTFLNSDTDGLVAFSADHFAPKIFLVGCTDAFLHFDQLLLAPNGLSNRKTFTVALFLKKLWSLLDQNLEQMMVLILFQAVFSFQIQALDAQVSYRKSASFPQLFW